MLIFLSDSLLLSLRLFGQQAPPKMGKGGLWEFLSKPIFPQNIMKWAWGTHFPSSFGFLSLVCECFVGAVKQVQDNNCINCINNQVLIYLGLTFNHLNFWIIEFLNYVYYQLNVILVTQRPKQLTGTIIPY